MTNEEAITYWESLRKTFSDHMQEAEDYWGKKHYQTSIEAIDAAIFAIQDIVQRCRMNENSAIDFAAWEPCERCNQSENELDRFSAHDFQIEGTDIYYYDTDDGWEGEEINFCPWCGRPLTKEAWEKLGKRLRGL